MQLWKEYSTYKRTHSTYKRTHYFGRYKDSTVLSDIHYNVSCNEYGTNQLHPYIHYNVV
jgi:hypothetical protein